MPKLMRNLTIKEVSGVDRAANLSEGWLAMYKSASPESQEVLKAAFAAGNGHEIPTGRTEEMPFDRDSLPAEAQAYIKSLEDKLTAPVAPGHEPTAEEIFAKSLESAPEPIRKALVETQRRAVEAEALAKSMAEERDRQNLVAKAAEMNIPGYSPEDLGETMRKAMGGDADSVAKLVEALGKSGEVIKSSAAFTEIGSSAPAPDSPAGQLEQVAKSLMSEDNSLDFATAMTKAVAADPSAYVNYRRELNGRN